MDGIIFAACCLAVIANPGVGKEIHVEAAGQKVKNLGGAAVDVAGAIDLTEGATEQVGHLEEGFFCAVVQYLEAAVLVKEITGNDLLSNKALQGGSVLVGAELIGSDADLLVLLGDLLGEYFHKVFVENLLVGKAFGGNLLLIDDKGEDQEV